MRLTKMFFFVLLLCAAWEGRTATYEPSSLVPPGPDREFRGVWVSSVGEDSWLAQAGPSTAAQKAYLVTIMDMAVHLKLNAVIFHVRPACDALYASRLEPWSENLTGTMGKAPRPYYDPLAFAIEEAHKRGLELHAWFNPYRALHFTSRSTIPTNHITRARPQLVRRYGNYVCLDPGERQVQDHTVNVVMDVVNRYDVDGVQFDDYFYPDRTAADGDFPDSASWKRFGASTGLTRDDWRRENVNTLIQRVYSTIKAAKPWVKFGVSPAGIWRPGFPESVRGRDAYTAIYADSRKWLMNGWLDYFAPQLYWTIQAQEQSFPVLLAWWSEQNVKRRHLWPGLAAYNAPRWSAEEIPEQIQIVRNQSSVPGYILFNATSLINNAGLAGALKQTVNSAPALVPSSPWLGIPPARPALTAGTNQGWPALLRATWQVPGGDGLRHWVLQTRLNGEWTTQILPPNKTSQIFQGSAPEAIAVSAVDRAGNMSPAAVVALVQPRPAAGPTTSPAEPSPPTAPKRPLRKLSSPKNGGK
jgi:uncharacterized lipoprotein YddW (UPF0748 family)